MRIGDRFAVDRGDDVAVLEAGRGRRRVLLGLGDERALGVLEAEAVGDILRDRLDLHPEPAARDLAVVLQCWTTPLATSLAMAKPMPTLPPDGEKIAVLTPTTSPSALKVGPPELP